MCRLRVRTPKALLSAAFCLACIFWSCKCGNAAAPVIPIEGAVYHVHRPDGSHKTHLDVVVGRSFPGRLPDDIDSITVAGPTGQLPIDKNDFKYNPQTRFFRAILPGFPPTGKYTFKMASGESFGFAADIQSSIRTLPIPDLSKFRPAQIGDTSCSMPEFSWEPVNDPNAVYYHLQIRELNRGHVFKTDYVRDMFSVRIPPGTLKTGVSYQWRLVVADGPDWLAIENRSQSQWVTFLLNESTALCEYRYATPAAAEKDWEVSSLTQEGVDIDRISDLMQNILNGNIRDIHSLLIVRNGKLVLEEYFHGYARNSTHSMMSVTKSIASLLVGIALDQKKIAGTDEKICDFFHSYNDAGWTDAKNSILLKHVLSMTAGLNWNYWEFSDTDPHSTSQSMIRSDDWIRFTLERDMADTPGRKFVYSNGLSMLLGEILKNATGEPADEFAEKYLFGPLGISDFSWQKIPNGAVNTAWGLKLRPRDMAKIGCLMLKKGKWNGKKIVSSSWVDESTKAQSEGDSLMGSGYGYQWWRGRTRAHDRNIEVFYAAGKGGQYIFVCPELDLVTVVTSKPEDHPMGEHQPQILMVNAIIPAMLPMPPPRGTVELDPAVLDGYVGRYENQRLKIPLTIFKKNGVLFFGNGRESGALIAQATNKFYGASKEIGEFHAVFIEDGHGGIRCFTVQVGFGLWRFDKISY